LSQQKHRPVVEIPASPVLDEETLEEALLSLFPEELGFPHPVQQVHIWEYSTIHQGQLVYRVSFGKLGTCYIRCDVSSSLMQLFKDHTTSNIFFGSCATGQI
jgi:hypothetical protein